MASSYSPFGRVVRADTATSTHAEISVLAEHVALWLSFSVPLAISEIRSWSDTAIAHARAEATDLISSHSDALLAGRKLGGPALAALARAFAICASVPGGITALGIHACLEPHDHCPATTSSPAIDRDVTPTATTRAHSTNTSIRQAF